MDRQRDIPDTVILELDKPRELRLCHKAMRRFSAVTKLNLGEIGTAIDRYDIQTELLYQMLAAEDPELTRDRLDDLIDEAERAGRLTFDDVSEKVIEAVLAHFGGRAEDGENAPESDTDPTPAAGTGA